MVPASLGKARILLWTAVASSGAILLFLAATGFTTQRYEVDFLPLGVVPNLIPANSDLNQTAAMAIVVATIESLMGRGAAPFVYSRF